jgi:hypothetical protein
VSIESFAFYGSQGSFGPTVCIDPTFSFYESAGWSQWAKAVKNQGHTAADLVVYKDDPSIGLQQEIVEAFRDGGVACRLRLYPPTYDEAYDNVGWRQKMLGYATFADPSESRQNWRKYLCPNDKAFSKFYEEKVEELCREVPYHAVQFAEPWFEVWGGADRNENPEAWRYYACLCDDCRSEFEKRTSGINPWQLFDESGDLYFKNPQGKLVYDQWVSFRVDSILSFCKRCYNAARRGRPGIKIIHMYLSDCTIPHSFGFVREYQAMDLDRIVTELGPDMLTIEDSWQDWRRSDLKPSFILKYGEAYVRRIKGLAPQMKIQSHLDVGSPQDDKGTAVKRSYAFMRAFSAYTHRAGFDSPSYYEYSIQSQPLGSGLRKSS